ncbi:hypothetical protein M422DRAFT_28115 [Sphaerobolus stellatus SS14]|nr:hypothetical protein M422DRAFT_28115 [Sphaerobolus stellatus SS14]
MPLNRSTQFSPAAPYGYAQSLHTVADPYMKDSSGGLVRTVTIDGRLEIVDGPYIKQQMPRSSSLHTSEPLSPFTPLTPSSPSSSSTASSPHFTPTIPIKKEDLSYSNMSGHDRSGSGYGGYPDGRTTRSSSQWPASSRDGDAPPPSHSVNYSSSRTSHPSRDGPPNKKIRSAPQSAAYTGPSSFGPGYTPGVKMPEYSYEPVPRSSRRGNSSNESTHYASSSRRKESSAASQAVKFRFVSVQHSDSATAGPSSGRHGGRGVHLEEHIDDDEDEGPFEHGPTDFPPRSYMGEDHQSPLRQQKPVGKIPASHLDYLPLLEERFSRLETAVDRYVDQRAQRALENSILPGSSSSHGRPSSSSRRS